MITVNGSRYYQSFWFRWKPQYRRRFRQFSIFYPSYVNFDWLIIYSWEISIKIQVSSFTTPNSVLFWISSLSFEVWKKSIKHLRLNDFTYLCTHASFVVVICVCIKTQLFLIQNGMKTDKLKHMLQICGCWHFIKQLIFARICWKPFNSSKGYQFHLKLI